ncbi:MerR family DNA-binding transcriptional regulator [Alloscardovia venturai]|uniref:MerR family DNA-binding transcriptional regulator n=1 Tax=Alloscardovia venturai TaxID=1769421 RepID=A0ABW2Y5F9_9BIFI
MSQLVHVSVRTLRYWEEYGVINSPEHT